MPSRVSPFAYCEAEKRELNQSNSGILGSGFLPRSSNGILGKVEAACCISLSRLQGLVVTRDLEKFIHHGLEEGCITP